MPARPSLSSLVLALLLGSAPAHADRAILIGTGAYPNLAPDLRLAAPPEDARRLKAALLRAGLPAADIMMMTDAEGTPPTRAAVLQALAATAATARAGEQILLYFSGHGAQAPTRHPEREPDGLDELYLMRDASGWDGGRMHVPDSISDAEMADAIDAIRRAGADVWFVADTCHAAGLTRSAPHGADVRTKSVAPAALGIPAKPLPPLAATVPQPAPSGRFAAFYAAGPGGRALERRLPPGSADAAQLSQFSYALVRAIDAGRLRSLRDLAIALNAADASLGGDAPQPVFEGALDLSVLNLSADRRRRFLATRDGDALRLAAGVEEGIEPDTRFRLVDPADRRPIGFARAVEVRLGASRLRPDAPLPPGAIEAEPLAGSFAPSDVQARLLAAATPIVGRGAAEKLTVTARLWRPGPRPRCPALAPAAPPRPQTRPLDLLAPPPLGQCDVVLATIRNGAAEAADVSPFYVDAAGSLIALAFIDEAGVRLGPGEARQVAVRLLSQDGGGRPLPVGSERLLILALPADTPNPVDLRGLAAAQRFRAGDRDTELPDGAGALVYRWRVEPVSALRPR